MNIIPDLILAAVVITAFIIGCKKGLVKSVWKIAALAVTTALVMVLKKPAEAFLSGTRFAQRIYESIASAINIPQGGGVNVAESLHLPGFMQGQLNEGVGAAQSAAASINEAAARTLTGVVITVVVCVSLFILIRLILMAVYMILNGVSKAPVIHGVNALAGGLLAAVNIIFIALLALALFTLFAPADSGLYDVIEKSYVVKYLYDYNILLQLFMKV